MADLSRNLNINNILISQNLNGIIPFVFYGEDNFKAESNYFQFKFRTSIESYIDYSNIISPVLSGDTVTDVCVPESNSSKITHLPIFYVDLITDSNVVLKSNVRGQMSRNETKIPDYTFIIPKFEWDMSLMTEYTNSDSRMSNRIGSVWVGTNDKKIYRLDFSNINVKATMLFQSDSSVANLLFDKNNSKMYMTTYDHIYKYTIENYLNILPLLDTQESLTVTNFNPSEPDKVLYNDNKNICLSQDNELWAVKSYEGKIIKLNNNTLLEIESYDGFDSPFKIIKSKYHNCYFVAGTYNLWKFNNGVKKQIYNIKNLKISDFDVSESGEIAILFNNEIDNYGIIRILDKNFYRLLYDEKSYNNKLKYVKNYNGYNFYAISEVIQNDNISSFNHYIYDGLSGEVAKYNSSVSINPLFESSSEEVTSQKILISYPNGGESFLLGDKITILWKSTESVTDKVSITLYKDSEIYSVIIDETLNTGSYVWDTSGLEEGYDYKIELKWIGVPPNSYTSKSISSFYLVEQYSSSSDFILPTLTGTIIGIDYDSYNNTIVVVLDEGRLGFFDLNTKIFTGLLNLKEEKSAQVESLVDSDELSENLSDDKSSLSSESSISSSDSNNKSNNSNMDISFDKITCMAVKDERVKLLGNITKVRVFVGSQPYLNDKWDSGEIETSLTSMLYGGGNNLVSGETYYVNIQVYSSINGWSQVQTKTFKMI